MLSRSSASMSSLCGKPEFARDLAECEQESKNSQLCLLAPPPTSHMALFKSVALLSSLHPFSGKPILYVWNKVTDPILKGILFEGKYSKLNERIYPSYQIFIYYSIGPQSQHYPWEEVKSTYQEYVNYLNSTSGFFFFFNYILVYWANYHNYLWAESRL